MLNKYTILFAEDEKETRDNLAEALSFMVKDVYLAEDGKEALNLYEEQAPDIIILDIEMPYLTGLEVARKIRETNKTVPIIISTAYTNAEYFLEAFELNLTTYLLKPISIKDLTAALKKCLTNLEYNKKEIRYFSSEIYYNTVERTLYSNNKKVPLRNTQMQFIEYLLKNPNRVISYEEFERNIWEEGMSGAAIRSLVRDTRMLLPENTIVNIAKVGYKLEIS